jgi:hypothetical protein
MVAPTAGASPDAAPPDEPRSWPVRFGGLVGAGALGSALATVPAALRLDGAPGVCTPAGSWALLFGVALVPMCLAVLALGRARSGFSALRGGDAMTPVVTLLVWLLSCFACFTLLGALLRSRTHHRALGGVVYAFVALVIAVALALALARVASVARRASATTRWVLAGLGAAALGFVVASVRHRLAVAADPPFSSAQAARLVDGLAFALSAIFASTRALSQRRALALVGPPLAAVVLYLGLSAWQACPSLSEALQERAPVFSWVVQRSSPDPR